jgi:hypothetical protein
MKTYIEVLRSEYTSTCTIGKMYINGKSFCYTLEDVVRDANKDGDLKDEGEAKVHGKTAIPSGKYKVIVDESNRFKKQMPKLLNVPGFEGIRIHAGNTDADTHGCILVGMGKGLNCITTSKPAFEELMKVLSDSTEVEISINDLK